MRLDPAQAEIERLRTALVRERHKRALSAKVSKTLLELLSLELEDERAKRRASDRALGEATLEIERLQGVLAELRERDQPASKGMGWSP